MKPMRLSEVMDKIFEFPGIYIGSESASRAFFFVCGYSVALQQMDDKWEDKLEKGFSGWVCKKFHYSPSHTWASVCIFHSPDEQGAFKLARELWKEYKAETTT